MKIVTWWNLLPGAGPWPLTPQILRDQMNEFSPFLHGFITSLKHLLDFSETSVHCGSLQFTTHAHQKTEPLQEKQWAPDISLKCEYFQILRGSHCNILTAYKTASQATQRCLEASNDQL